MLTAAVPARVSFQVDCDDDVPAVMADAGQIEQILINLCTNALQAIGEQNGRIEIRLDCHGAGRDSYAKHHPSLLALHAKRPGRTVRLAVIRHRAGMDAATLDRIFEPFFTTKPVGSGTGLGLVRGARHHPIPWRRDRGCQPTGSGARCSRSTCQRPRRPLGATRGAEPALQRDLDRRWGATRGCSTSMTRNRWRRLAKRLLESHGYRVTGCSDPLQALEVLRADPQAFDVVITDYNMPSMSGLDVARKVREIRSDLPVAIASGFADETLQMQYAEAGVQEIVSKLGAMEGLARPSRRALKPGRPA